MNLEERLYLQACAKDAHTFIFGMEKPNGEHIQFLYTKDEHNLEATQPFPDFEYLRVLVDLFLVGGRFIKPREAKWALKWGLPAKHIEDTYRTGLLAIEKSRQLMVTWVCLAYALWRAKFHEHQLILVQSKREDDAQSLVCKKKDELDASRLTFMEFHLPLYMRNVRRASMSKCNVYFETGSRVWGIPQGGSIIRSNTSSLLISDEAAFQPEFGEAYRAALPAVRGGGQAIFVSSAEVGDFQALVEGVG